MRCQTQLKFILANKFWGLELDTKKIFFKREGWT